MELRKRRPTDGKKLRGRIELHRAGAQRNHRVGQRQVLVFEVLEVAHHRRLGAVAVEDGVVQVIDCTELAFKRGRHRSRRRHRLESQHFAQVAEILRVGALVEGHAHVDTVREIPQVDPLALRALDHGPHVLDGKDHRVEEMAVDRRTSRCRSGFGQGTGQAMNALGNRAQSLGTMVHRVHARHHGQQALGGADVGGRLVAADVLLTGLQGHAVGHVAHAVHRRPNHAAGYVSLVVQARGEEGRMRSPVAHRHAETLAVAHHHVGTHGTRTLHEGASQEVRGHHHAHLEVVRLGNRVGQGFHPPAVIGVLDHHAKCALAQLKVVVRALLDVDAEVRGARAQDRPRLGEDPVRHHEPVHAGLGRLAAAGIEQHGHGLRSGSGLVQQAGVGQLHAGQVAHHGLEVHQGFQSALGNLRLIRRVGRVPTRILQHIPANHTWHFRGVIPQADVVPIQRILGRDAVDVLQVSTLGHGLRQRHVGIGQDGLGNGAGNQSGHGVMTGGGQHVLLLLIAGTEVALDERCGCHVAERIKGQK